MEQSGISTLFATSIEHSTAVRHLDTKALATTTARLRIRIAEFESTADHFIRKIQMRTAQVKGTLGID